MLLRRNGNKYLELFPCLADVRTNDNYSTKKRICLAVDVS